MICVQNFETESRLFELNASDQIELESSDSRLIHVECTVCKMCNLNIHESGEYILEKSKDKAFSLMCKCCSIKKLNSSDTKSKKVFNSNNRLSSRQKELLASKILAEKIEFKKVLTESSEIVKYLSTEIKCSKKSLVYYLNSAKRNWTKSENKKNTYNCWQRIISCGDYRNSDLVF